MKMNHKVISLCYSNSLVHSLLMPWIFLRISAICNYLLVSKKSPIPIQTLNLRFTFSFNFFLLFLQPNNSINFHIQCKMQTPRFLLLFNVDNVFVFNFLGCLFFGESSILFMNHKFLCVWPFCNRKYQWK